MSGQGDRYQEHEPPPSLRPFVRTIWTYSAPTPERIVQRIAPDGCPELVIDIGDPYEEQGPDGLFRLQPRALFAGQMTRPLALRPAGPVELVAVRFEPDGARDWLGLPLVEATDRRLDMTARTAALRPPAGDPSGQVEVMADWLEAQRRAAAWSIDPAVRREVEAAGQDRASPARPSAEHRALQRRFRDRVGVPPRLLRSILRFRRVFDHAAGVDRRLAGGGPRGGVFRPAADGPGLPPLSRLHGDGMGSRTGRAGAQSGVAILQAGTAVAALGSGHRQRGLTMPTAAVLAAVLMQAAPSVQPDAAFMAGYWLDCSNGREASETWSDPRAGLMVGHAVTVGRDGRASFEVSHIGQTPGGFAYVAQPGGAPPTAFALIEAGPNRAVFANAENDFPTRVIYEREGDALKARIEGEIDGRARSMEWNFRAAPLNTRCPLPAGAG